ncbi:uncharacterized protein LOC134346458 [Mobula hypostoma]|uniref:uncharacterized protein LOC134346458 n=1 Tax=Mobula hypostoma TaxID=723540 RepID=UPI002FC32E60
MGGNSSSQRIPCPSRGGAYEFLTAGGDVEPPSSDATTYDSVTPTGRDEERRREWRELVECRTKWTWSKGPKGSDDRRRLMVDNWLIRRDEERRREWRELVECRTKWTWSKGPKGSDDRRRLMVDNWLIRRDEERRREWRELVECRTKWTWSKALMGFLQELRIPPTIHRHTSCGHSSGFLKMLGCSMDQRSPAVSVTSRLVDLGIYLRELLLKLVFVPLAMGRHYLSFPARVLHRGLLSVIWNGPCEIRDLTSGAAFAAKWLQCLEAEPSPGPHCWRHKPAS